MTLFFLPDIVITLATLAVVLVLLDKGTGRLLAHLDTLRVLANKVCLDIISILKASRQAHIDIEQAQLAVGVSQENFKIEKERAQLELRRHRRQILLADDTAWRKLLEGDRTVKSESAS